MPAPVTNADFLKIYDALPDLLQLSRERSSENLYAFQDELREQYRMDGLAFRWSMPLRCFGKCQQCDEKFTQIIYQLEDPRNGTAVGTNSTHLHAVRQHSAELNSEVKQFLNQLD